MKCEHDIELLTQAVISTTHSSGAIFKCKKCKKIYQDTTFGIKEIKF